MVVSRSIFDRFYCLGPSSSCVVVNGLEVTVRTFHEAHIMPNKDAQPVAISIGQSTESALENRKNVLPRQTITAMKAQAIEAGNFLALMTGATPTIATTKTQYFIAMNMLLTMMLKTLLVSKFESNLLNTNPYASCTRSIARNPIGNIKTHLSAGCNLLTNCMS